MASVKKNYFYSAFFQIYSILLGLISSPYLSRVLGPEGLGVNAYVNAVLSYFVLFGTLSSDFFAARESIYSGKSKKIFWNIFFLRAFILLLSLFVYLVFLFSTSRYRFYFAILLISLVAHFFNITWYYYAVESFKVLALRNFLVRTATFVPMFFIVKSPKDLWKFLLITSVTNFVANISIFLRPARFNRPVYLNLSDTLHLFPKAWKMFLPEISISIYAFLDRLMIEWFSSSKELGFYEVASRFPSVALSLITAMTPIMMSRMSDALSKGEAVLFQNYIAKSFKFSVLLSSFFLIIFLSIARDFIPWFFGKQYIASVSVMYVKIFIVLCVSLGVVAGHQSLVALKKEKYLTLSVTIGAVVNATLNAILIPKQGAYGAAVASLIAELVVMLALYMFLSRFVNLGNILHSVPSLLIPISITAALSIVLSLMSVNWILRGSLVAVVYLFILFKREPEIRNLINALFDRLFRKGWF